MTERPNLKGAAKLVLVAGLYSVIPSAELNIKERLSLNANAIVMLLWQLIGNYPAAYRRSLNVADLMGQPEIRKEMEKL